MGLLDPLIKYSKVILKTTRGDIRCRFYKSKDSLKAIIAVGGVGGGFDSPAKGLYSKLGEDLKSRGISTLRVRFRNPTDLQEAVFDVLSAVEFLKDEGVSSIGLIGHSFGGAVVIQVACLEHTVRTVVALASQSFGTDCITSFAPNVSILLIHGEKDRTLPAACSKSIYEAAHEPKRLILIGDAGHSLDENAPEIFLEIRQWLIQRLQKNI